MNYLLDTNILLRLAEESNSQYQLTFDAIKKLHERDHDLAVTAQVIYEYWVVITRSQAQNGLGMTATQANNSIDYFLSDVLFLPDHAGIFSIWKDLVNTHQVLGKKAHDARLAATAIYYECDGIVTFNAPDFQRFAPLKILTPEQVLLA